MTATRQYELIREALARALFDADASIFDAFKRDFDHTGALPLARRVVRELKRDGWVKKPGSGRRRDMELEDEIAFGISLAGKAALANVASDDRKTAGEGRAVVARKVCEALNLAKIVLARKRPKVIESE
jgi:hypothetical protein